MLSGDCLLELKELNVVSAEWVVLGPDFGDAPNVNTEQYCVMAGVCWWLFTGALCF